MRKRMRAPDLLQALLEAPGPSGHEEAPTRIWRHAASAFAEVTADTLGTSFARVRSPRSDAATVALVGHIDEVGVTVTNVEDSGLLSFTTVGGVSPETLSGQRIEFLTRDGSSVPGAIGRKRLSPEERRDAPRVELVDLQSTSVRRHAKRPRVSFASVMWPSGTARRPSRRTAG
jgi:endoglucanase